MAASTIIMMMKMATKGGSCRRGRAAAGYWRLASRRACSAGRIGADLITTDDRRDHVQDSWQNRLPVRTFASLVFHAHDPARNRDLDSSKATMDDVLSRAPGNWYIEANEAKSLGLVSEVL
jgi:hypothetical protein